MRQNEKRYDTSNYTYYKVYFNNGSSISADNSTLIKIPKWKLDISDVKADLNAKPINQNNISYGKNNVNVGDTIVKIDDGRIELNNKQVIKYRCQ